MRWLLDRVHRRFRRARSGSVLILVIALLVLMALIGTAFITTTRTDRQASTQNEYNTQIELLVQAAVASETDALLRHIYRNQQFRPDVYPAWDGLGDPNPPSPPTIPYAATDPTPAEADINLADRMPVRLDNTWANGQPFWHRISASPVGASNPKTQFESPRAPNPKFGAEQYGDRMVVTPTFIPMTDASGRTRYYPGLILPNGKTVLAADADGDGVADAGLIKFPIGQINGVTYYFAVRAIDNGSALNVNVATKPFYRADWPTSPPPQVPVPGNFFPTNISLYDLIGGDNNQFAALNAFRWLGAPQPKMALQDAFDNRPYNDPVPPRISPPTNGVLPTARTDFLFGTAQEALYAQLGARLNNPGWHTSLISGGPPEQYHVFSLSDSMALAYHFCLANLDASLSPVENCLLGSTRMQVSTRAPYSAADGQDPADAIKNWFNDQFNFDAGPGAPPRTDMPLRSLLVARNPVSTFTPDRFRNMGGYNGANAYQFGDRVTMVLPRPFDGVPQAFSFVCIRPKLASGPTPKPSLIPNSPGNAYWAVQPWTSHPTKINVNTATFGQLWSAYYAAMARAPAPLVAGATNPNLPVGADTRAPKASQQFKTFIRGFGATGPTIDQLTYYQARQLRAALAAVNTIDLRDGDDGVAGQVTSRSIVLTDSLGNPKYNVDIYGTEKQPYITEAFVDYNPVAQGGGPPGGPPAGQSAEYIAIELYNPHSVPISLWGVKLFIRNHDVPGSLPAANLLYDFTNVPGGPVMAPGEKIVLENSQANRPADVTAEINASPARKVEVTGKLEQLTQDAGLGGPHRELYLLRSRLAQPPNPPAIPASDAAWDHFNELDPSNLVPLDQLDFTHITVPPVDLNPQPGQENFEHRYRYARGSNPKNAPNSTAWWCVYPGGYLYAPTQLDKYAHDAWQHDKFDPASLTAGTPRPAPFAPGLGLGKGAGGPAMTFLQTPRTSAGRPIQIANRDAAGPNNPLYTGGPASYPFGGFARNGDIQQVTFTGSYTIRAYQDPPVPGPNVHDHRTDFLDMVSVTLDSFYATDALDDTTALPDGSLVFLENIGRFCPLYLSPGNVYNDFAPPDLNSDVSSRWRYNFATDLFDFVDVRSPQDDYLPNVDPGDPATQQPRASWTNPEPNPVNNGPGTDPAEANLGREDRVGEDGKININTVGWRVLATLPMVTNNDGSINLAVNTDLAKAIVAYRDIGDLTVNPPKPAHGPFRNIFELLQVPGFATANHTSLTDMANPYQFDADDADGDVSPFDTGSPALAAPGSPPEMAVKDQVYGDFETPFLALTRISNLITTRSDSFTVYVVVQGWRNVGTANPELVVQRRVAFLADRSSVRPIPGAGNTASHTPMNVVTMPND